MPKLSHDTQKEEGKQRKGSKLMEFLKNRAGYHKDKAMFNKIRKSNIEQYKEMRHNFFWTRLFNALIAMILLLFI